MAATGCTTVKMVDLKTPMMALEGPGDTKLSMKASDYVKNLT